MAIGKLNDRIVFQSSPERYRGGILAGNITETHADIVVFSDGYGWEHGAPASNCSLFLPNVPYGNNWAEWAFDIDEAPALKSAAKTSVNTSLTPSIAIYYTRH